MSIKGHYAIHNSKWPKWGSIKRTFGYWLYTHVQHCYKINYYEKKYEQVFPIEILNLIVKITLDTYNMLFSFNSQIKFKQLIFYEQD